MATLGLINTFSQRFEHMKGKESWLQNLRLTAFAADRIRSSLGPNGAYKMVSYSRGPEKVVKITRDAVAVVEELAIQYPTLVVLSEAAKLQRQEIGDGVKSFIILTAELLKSADKLVSKGVHQTIILKGYHEAAAKALETIKLISGPLHESEFYSVLESLDCGRGFLTPDVQKMLIDANTIATSSGRLDAERIRVIRKPGGTLSETNLVKGLLVKKGKLHPNMPETIDKPKIALTSGRIGINRTEIKMPTDGPFHMNLNIAHPQDLIEYKNVEKQRKADALASLEEKGVNVLYSQQPIDDYSKNRLLRKGILAFASVDRADLTMISKATGARIISNLNDLEETDIGSADRIEMDKIGLEDISIINNCQFATFIIRGSSLQALDELELLIRNAVHLLQVAEHSHKKVPGGGAVELQVAKKLKNFALKFSGREQLAIDAFAEALLEIPRSLAANNGFFPDDALAQLWHLHSEGLVNYGLYSNGGYGAVNIEVSEAKIAMVRRALEVATLLLRIDEQVVAKEIPKFHKQ